jgi:hypothetical protein
VTCVRSKLIGIPVECSKISTQGSHVGERTLMTYAPLRRQAVGCRISSAAHSAAANIQLTADSLHNGRTATAHHVTTKPKQQQQSDSSMQVTPMQLPAPAVVPAIQHIEPPATTTRRARAVLLPRHVPRPHSTSTRQQRCTGCMFGVQLTLKQLRRHAAEMEVPDTRTLQSADARPTQLCLCFRSFVDPPQR